MTTRMQDKIIVEARKICYFIIVIVGGGGTESQGIY
jgi:hypothetical protein